jgi:hypothetical protein
MANVPDWLKLVDPPESPISIDQVQELDKFLSEAKDQGATKEDLDSIVEAAGKEFGIPMKTASEFGRIAGIRSSIPMGVPVLREWYDEIGKQLDRLPFISGAEKAAQEMQSRSKVAREYAPVYSTIAELGGGAAATAPAAALFPGAAAVGTTARTGRQLPSIINTLLSGGTIGGGVAAGEQAGREGEVTAGETGLGILSGMTGGLGGRSLHSAGRWLSRKGADTQLGRALGLGEKYALEDIHTANVGRTRPGGSGIPSPAPGANIPFEQAGSKDLGLLGKALSTEGAPDPDILLAAGTDRLRGIGKERGDAIGVLYDGFRRGGDLTVDRNWHDKLRTEATWRALKDYRSTHPQEAMDLANNLGFNLNLDIKHWDFDQAFTDISRGRMPTTITRETAENLRSMLASRVEPDASGFKIKQQSDLANQVIDALPDQPGKDQWRTTVDEAAKVFEDTEAMTQRLTGKKIDELTTKAVNTAESEAAQSMPGDPYQRLMYRMAYGARTAAKSLYESQRPSGFMPPIEAQNVLDLYSRPNTRIEDFLPAGEQLARRRGLLSSILIGTGAAQQPTLEGAAAVGQAGVNAAQDKYRGLMDRLNPSP